MAAMSGILRSRKLSPSIAIIAAVGLVLGGVLVGLFEEELYRSQRVGEVQVQAEILAASVTAALVFNDARAAQGYVDALAVNPELQAAGVYDAMGRRVAGFMRMGAVPPPDTAAAAPAAFNNNRVVAALPVVQNGMPVGMVYLRVVTDSIERRLVRYGGIFLLVTMGLLLLAVVNSAQHDLALRARALAEANARLVSEMAERAKAEEALRQSQKMEAIGQLSGGIAHDFNNLLTIIKGNLQLMQRRIAQGRTDTQRYIDAAMEGLNRAATLTQRILAFSRRQPLSPAPVDLKALVTGMVDILRHSVGPNIEIETHLNSQWQALCDANQMENVVLNLAINARDAMPEGGKLVIATDDISGHVTAENAMPGEYVRLVVRDTGTGMSEEVRERAIDPFFTTKPQGKGTGLGLSMTFGYIRQSNGHFTIESELGKGTTITILIPRYSVERIPAATA
jgi:signal transduction histidine kinase